MNAKTSLFLFFALLIIASCSGEEQKAPLPRRGAVNDLAGILSEESTAVLSKTLEDYERETCHRYVVLIVAKLGGEDISELSYRTVRDWEISRPPLENGLLVTIAVEEGEGRIDAGKGLEGIFTSGAAEAILQGEMFPLFGQGDFAGGLARGIDSLMVEGRKVRYAPELRPPVCR